MNKDLIQARFSKSLSSYNENARIQKKMAKKLMSFLSSKKYNNILEIGCGTGFLTELLNNNLEFENYTAIDIVEECKNYIEQINSDINFVHADIETYVLQTAPDLIISNASLQWVNNFETIINKLKNNLSENGELIFSTFGTENFKEISFLTGTALSYYSTKELEEMFPLSLIEPEIHIMAFENPKDVLKHLQLTGVNALQTKSWTKKDLTRFENGYRNLCSKRPTLTYNPIYIKIQNKTTG